MNIGLALTLTLSSGRENKRSLAPFSPGRRIRDEGQPYLHSVTQKNFHLLISELAVEVENKPGTLTY